MTEVIGLWSGFRRESGELEGEGQKMSVLRLTLASGSACPYTSQSIGFVAATRFTKDEGIVMAMEAESLLNAASDRNSRIPAGNAEAVGEYPYFAGAVLYLKNAIPHRAE